MEDANFGLFLYKTVIIKQTKKNWNSVDISQSHGKQQSCPILFSNGYRLDKKIAWVQRYLSHVADISLVITLQIGPAEITPNIDEIPIIMTIGSIILMIKWIICSI